jgi:hypothetical protein
MGNIYRMDMVRNTIFSLAQEYLGKTLFLSTLKHFLKEKKNLFKKHTFMKSGGNIL